MSKVTAIYLEGIQEGRQWLRTARAEGAVTRAMIEREIANVTGLRDRVAPLAGSEGQIGFLDGEVDFYVNQLGRVES